MRKVLVLLLFVLVGFSGDDIWEANGNLKEEHVVEMQRAWCEYNDGREFITNQCDSFKESSE